MSELDKRALPIPPAITEETLNADTHEIIRAWWDGQQPRMMIRATFNDYANVGTLLAELAWHFSNAYSDSMGADKAKVLADIRERWLEQQAVYDARDPALKTSPLGGGASSQ